MWSLSSPSHAVWNSGSICQQINRCPYGAAPESAKFVPLHRPDFVRNPSDIDSTIVEIVTWLWLGHGTVAWQHDHG